MKLLLIVAAVAALIALIPYLRIFIKRLELYFRLRAYCRRKGCILLPTHTFWMFGSRRGRRCDFYIVSDFAVYSVKLWAMRSYHTELHITDDGSYFVRGYLAFAAGLLSRVPVDSKRRRLHICDFRPDFRDEWYIKPFYPVLLINPTCYEFRYNTNDGETVVGAGEMLHGMYIYTLSRLLGELDSIEQGMNWR